MKLVLSRIWTDRVDRWRCRLSNRWHHTHTTIWPLESLESNELILSDLEYLGESQILTPHKRPKTSEQQTENNTINKKRVIVENVIKRFKDFHALSTKWRHSLQNHKTVFFVISEIVNIDLFFRLVRNKWNGFYDDNLRWLFCFLM
jgi:hypothetical protein